MAITINGKTYRNLQQQVLQNMNDIAEIKEHGTGESYSAGTGINISDENVISIDNTVETKANATSRFVSKANLTDYSINEIIVGNSQVDSDNVDLRAVYSQDVKSEVSLDPTSTIIRTMSGTDTSTIGISATEIDITTSMLKYGTSEVATKEDIPTYTEGQGITITNSNEIKANIGYGLEFSATESDTDEIKINTNVIATKENLVDYYAGTNITFTAHTGGGFDINATVPTLNRYYVQFDVYSGADHYVISAPIMTFDTLTTGYTTYANIKQYLQEYMFAVEDNILSNTCGTINSINDSGCTFYYNDNGTSASINIASTDAVMIGR